MPNFDSSTSPVVLLAPDETRACSRLVGLSIAAAGAVTITPTDDLGEAVGDPIVFSGAGSLDLTPSGIQTRQGRGVRLALSGAVRVHGESTIFTDAYATRVLGVPTDLTLATDDGESIQPSYTPPTTGGYVEGYESRYRDSESTDVDGDWTAGDPDSLTYGETYEVQVRAVGAGNRRSPWTGSSTIEMTTTTPEE